MARYPTAITCLLMTCLAYAQDDASSIPPSETVPVLWVVVFGILFVGMIVGFFVYLWWKERGREKNG
jgi:dipeptide/tripeptide permease